MSVAKVIEISATSETSFEDAITHGIEKASQTLRNLRGAWIKEQKVEIENGKVARYVVHLLVTFVLDEE